MTLERRDPACGWTSQSIRILCLRMFLSASASLCAQTPSTACAAKDQSDAMTIRGYSFRSYGGDEKTCLKVLHEGKQVFRTDEVGGAFTLGKIGDVTSPGGVVPGTDVTGRGHPDVLISYFSGGAHCCFELLLFELEPQFALLARIGLGSE